MASIRKRIWTGAGGEKKTAWVADYFDQTRQRHIKTFALKKDAQEWLHGTVGQVKSGTHTAERNSVTVAEAATAWIERGELEGLEKSSLNRYRRHANLHINPYMGSVKLAKLSTPMVLEFKQHLQRKFPNGTISTYRLDLLKGIIKHAQISGKIAHDPAAPVTFGNKFREKRKLQIGVDIPDINEIRALIHEVEGRWRPLLITAVFTGMQISELRGLRWSDVDFADRVVHVRQRADEFQKLGPVKTKTSRREIPISGMVINVLKEWKLACPKGELDLCFPNGVG